MRVRKTYLRLLLITLGFIIILYPGFETYSQSNINPPSVDYRFDEYLIFQGVLNNTNLIRGCKLFINISGENTIFSTMLEIGSQGNFKYEFPLVENPIRAFSKISYWLEIENVAGQVLASEQRTLTYADNRYQWEKIIAYPIEVYWYKRDRLFGQHLIDTAQTGLERNKNILPLNSPESIKIYAYESSLELRDTLQIAEQTWIGAHTDPDLGIIMLSIPNSAEQVLEMERQIPHELMHILLFYTLGTNYKNLPLWLNEGLASIAELSPNPNYSVLLQKASEQDNLLPIVSLCKNFPKDASGAYLAYSESASFTNFLLKTYGSAKLMDVVLLYQDGMECDRAISNVFIQDLNSLDKQWRKVELGEIIWKDSIMKIAPWLILLICVIATPIIFFISTINKFQTPKQSEMEEKVDDV